MLSSEFHFEDKTFCTSFALTFRDCDARKQIKLSAVLGIAGDTAGMDYTARGLPYDTLFAQRTVFLLSRYAVRFVRTPREAEIVTVRTWERGTEGAYFLRDYEYLDASGAPCLYITSAWILVDPVTRRPLRPSAFTAGVLHSSDRRLDCPDTARLRPDPERMNTLGSRPVYYSDLDGNGHLSNGKYGDVAVDYLPEEYRQRPLTTFEINYVREARLGDTLDLAGGADGDTFVMQGTRGGADGFVCRFAFA